MSIEVQVEVVLTLANARAILDAARPFTRSIANDATKKLADALKPLDAAVDPILEALTGEPPPTETLE